jgi:hypothetical protein
MYYIISLQHTKKGEKFITLWRPNNRGYCMNKEWAGIYTELISGYHDNPEECLLLKVEEAERLFVKDTDYWGEPHLAIPNNKTVWDKIGVKMTKHGLVKKYLKEIEP